MLWIVNDVLNSAIIDALDKVVVSYRRGGAPVAVITEGSKAIARIASAELEVAVVTEQEKPVLLRMDRRPRHTNITTEIDIRGLAEKEIAQVVLCQFQKHLDQLASEGAHPFCDHRDAMSL